MNVNTLTNVVLTFKVGAVLRSLEEKTCLLSWLEIVKRAHVLCGTDDEI